jgi:hypothetical protein
MGPIHRYSIPGIFKNNACTKFNDVVHWVKKEATMAIGDQVLCKPEWETFARAMAEKKTRKEAYVLAYGETKNITQRACHLLKNERITDRVMFLSGGKIKPKVNTFTRKPKIDFEKELDLKSVIKTCREVIETTESTPQKLKAIEVLNKLGVFDGENKDEGRRMDPGAVCEYLAQFAGAPAKELARIPGGVKGLLKCLMELTGVSALQLIAELGETAHEPKPPVSEPSMPPESEKPADRGLVSVGNPLGPNAMFEKAPEVFTDPVLVEKKPDLLDFENEEASKVEKVEF